MNETRDTITSEERMAQFATCPHCGARINAGALLGASTSPAKAEAARRNGRLGGRPKKVVAASATE